MYVEPPSAPVPVALCWPPPHAAVTPSATATKAPIRALTGNRNMEKAYRQLNRGAEMKANSMEGAYLRLP
jgi:hypothetical protein